MNFRLPVVALMIALSLAGCAVLPQPAVESPTPPETPTMPVETELPLTLYDRAWTWVRTEMNDGTLTTPSQPDAFTITIAEDGSYTGTTDCNSFFGQAEIAEPQISLGPIGATKMYCEGSQESVFWQSLGEVESYIFDEATGELVLLIKFDSGSMTFR
jgi:heat shock protein HslJ